MKTIQKKFILLFWRCLLFWGFLLSGCTTYLDLYPEFPEKSQEIQKIQTYTEIAISQDRFFELTDDFDLSWNQDLHHVLVELVEQGLQKKGYLVESSDPLSIGLRLPPENQYYLHEQKISPPFFVHSDFREGEKQKLLRSFYEELAHYRPSKGKEMPQFSKIQELGLGKEGDTLLLLFLEGRDVRVSFRVGVGFASRNTGVSFNTGTASPGLLLRFYLIEANTGKLLWFDWAREQTSHRVVQDLPYLVRRILRNLPEKNFRESSQGQDPAM